jgi:endonuclease I/V8-like Glu-specific endopeptidase
MASIGFLPAEGAIGMTLTDRFLARLEETKHRFEERAEARADSELHLKEGDYVRANAREAIRSRLAHLGLEADLGGLETRELAGAEPDSRAVIENLALERILGRNDLMPVNYLLLGQHRARTVGRIHIRDQAGQLQGFGTGFLVSPQLLLTNNHVLDSARTARSSQVEFDYEDDEAGRDRQTVFFSLDPAAFFLTDQHLDFSLVAVAPEAAQRRAPREWGWNRLSEQAGLVVKGEYVSIVQHPQGEQKQIALRENQVIDLLEDFTHYRTDTAPGSSGSPVFNDQWELVALHHSGVPDRFADGDIKAVDGRRWQRWMGDHRIKWIANEGVSIPRIVDFVKRASGLNAKQKKLRDELFAVEPPVPETAAPPTIPAAVVLPAVPLAPTAVDHMLTASAASTTWTIPLHVTVQVGRPTEQTPPPSAVGVPGERPDDSEPGDADADLQQGLADLDQGRAQPYYDAVRDGQDRDRYYQGIPVGELSPARLFQVLSALVRDSHRDQPRYSPRLHVYPWVDLHPDRMLRSIYSGQAFEPEELIREDFRIQQEREMLLRELMEREGDLSPQRIQEQEDLLEDQNPFNCEHVVPQSWFGRREPMRGDLHHLFTCESGCNSFRGNLAYFDFSDFEEVVRGACGKREGDRFEPGAGKGAVARATLYFLLRYPRHIDDPQEFPRERVATLLAWHGDHPVTDYERHRNQAIFAKQGNRNPLIDHSDWAEKIDFDAGLR